MSEFFIAIKGKYQNTKSIFLTNTKAKSQEYKNRKKETDFHKVLRTLYQNLTHSFKEEFKKSH